MKSGKVLIGVAVVAVLAYVGYIFLKPGDPTSQIAEVIEPSQAESLEENNNTTQDGADSSTNDANANTDTSNTDQIADQQSDTSDTGQEDQMTSQNEELLDDAEVFVLPSEATVEWIGRKVGGQHNGYVRIEDSEILVADGRVVGGQVVMDMTTIKATDIDSEDLDNHLKAEDFFDVATYPRATFEITDIQGNTVQGLLTLKGETNTIRFEAEELTVENDTASFSASFAIDRTQRGVNGSQ